MGRILGVGIAADAGLLIGHTTVIQELVKSLECGATVANVLGGTLAGTTAGPLEGPGQAHGLARYLGDFDGVTFSELQDGGVLTVVETLQQVGGQHGS